MIWGEKCTLVMKTRRLVYCYLIKFNIAPASQAKSAGLWPDSGRAEGAESRLRSFDAPMILSILIVAKIFKTRQNMIVNDLRWLFIVETDNSLAKILT